LWFQKTTGVNQKLELHQLDEFLNSVMDEPQAPTRMEYMDEKMNWLSILDERAAPIRSSLFWMRIQTDSIRDKNR